MLAKQLSSTEETRAFDREMARMSMQRTTNGIGMSIVATEREVQYEHHSFGDNCALSRWLPGMVTTPNGTK
jgi:hypothetical protein